MGLMDRIRNATPEIEPAGTGRRRTLTAATIGVGAGAALAYLFDPQRGNARRIRLRDQGAATVRHAARAAGRAYRAISSAAAGKLEAFTTGGTRVPPIDDVTLRDRAETVLFRGRDVPKGSINISAERGILVLRGEVPTPEMAAKLGRKAEGIEGVWSVHNLLHAPGEPVPDLVSSTR